MGRRTFSEAGIACVCVCVAPRLSFTRKGCSAFILAELAPGPANFAADRPSKCGARLLGSHSRKGQPLSFTVLAKLIVGSVRAALDRLALAIDSGVALLCQAKTVLTGCSNLAGPVDSDRLEWVHSIVQTECRFKSGAKSGGWIVFPAVIQTKGSSASLPARTRQ